MMRFGVVRAGAAVLLFFIACKDRDRQASGAATGLFANASPDAREALATPVDFQLTEDNFDKWEAAQRNLDRVPASEFSGARPAGGTVVDRAVARLEGSARARRAIESAALSVRDFVLETIALAQAVQASRSGRSPVASGVPLANFAFVEQYRERIREAGVESELALQSGDSAITDPNTAEELQRANDPAREDSLEQGLTDSTRRRPRARDSTRDSLHDTIPTGRRP